jgi:hypothetical protein
MYKDSRYGIYLNDVVLFKIFQENRERLGLTETEYIRQLLLLDFTGEIILEKPEIKKKYVDLKQTRLYRNEDLKPEIKEK